MIHLRALSDSNISLSSILVERCKYRTGNDHHADGKNLLVIGLGGDVTKAHRRHASHREVQRGDVHGSPGRSSDQFRRGAGIGPQIAVR